MKDSKRSKEQTKQHTEQSASGSLWKSLPAGSVRKEEVADVSKDYSKDIAADVVRSQGQTEQLRAQSEGTNEAAYRDNAPLNRAATSATELTQTEPTMTLEHQSQTNLVNPDVPFMDSIPEYFETDSEFHVRTFDPMLWRRARIMVPVDVQALVIEEVKPNWCYDCDANLPEDNSGEVCTLMKEDGDPCNSSNIGQCWAELETEFSIPTPPVGPDGKTLAAVDTEYAIHPEPFSLKHPDWVRQPGVYLHWAMPDALMHGTPIHTDLEPEYLVKTPDLHDKIRFGEELENERADNELKDEFEFPQLPDRWLVVRTWPGSTTADPLNTKAWVIESDTLNVELLSSWETPGPSHPSDEMTAVGPGNGDPTWTVTYDNAEGRFTFHDSLGSGVTGPLNYLVTGWYSAKTSDPLWSNPNVERTYWFEILRELGWYVDSKSVEDATAAAESSASNMVPIFTRESITRRE